jgi:hypothetical protein
MQERGCNGRGQWSAEAALRPQNERRIQAQDDTDAIPDISNISGSSLSVSCIEFCTEWLIV